MNTTTHHGLVGGPVKPTQVGQRSEAQLSMDVTIEWLHFLVKTHRRSSGHAPHFCATCLVRSWPCDIFTLAEGWLEYLKMVVLMKAAILDYLEASQRYERFDPRTDEEAETDEQLLRELLAQREKLSRMVTD